MGRQRQSITDMRELAREAKRSMAGDVCSGVGDEPGCGASKFTFHYPVAPGTRARICQHCGLSSTEHQRSCRVCGYGWAADVVNDKEQHYWQCVKCAHMESAQEERPAPPKGLVCPECGTVLEVYYTRGILGGVKRRRRCPKCNQLWMSIERLTRL